MSISFNRSLVQEAWRSMASKALEDDPAIAMEALPDMGAWLLRIITGGPGDLGWYPTLTIVECLGYTIEDDHVVPIE